VKSVLIVEDHADLRRYLRLVLEAAGYSVREAANGREALVVQGEQRADVLITDIFMPERDGLETIDEFKRAFPDTVIIAMSGRTTSPRPNYLYAAREFGAHATLAKPFDSQALLDMLKALGC
jgi:CheY-like chemotaxis protein